MRTDCGPTEDPDGDSADRCAVQDGCSRRVIGRAIDEQWGADLVASALDMAVTMCDELAEMVFAHADRDCHYTSAQPTRFARRYDLTCSAERIGARLEKRCRRIIVGDIKSRVL